MIEWIIGGYLLHSFFSHEHTHPSSYPVQQLPVNNYDWYFNQNQRELTEQEKQQLQFLLENYYGKSGDYPRQD